LAQDRDFQEAHDEAGPVLSESLSRKHVQQGQKCLKSSGNQPLSSSRDLLTNRTVS